MIELVAAEVTVVIVVSAITGLVLVLTSAAAIWMFFASFGDHAAAVRDVQRFVELTEQARSLVPAGLPLFDQEKAAATTAAVGRFAAKKEQARQALWESRNKREPTAARPAPVTGGKLTGGRVRMPMGARTLDAQAVRRSSSGTSRSSGPITSS